MKDKLRGKIAHYNGEEHRPLRGHRLLVLKRIDRNRAEVTPWIEAAGRWSFVTYDPLIKELEFTGDRVENPEIPELTCQKK